MAADLWKVCEGFDWDERNVQKLWDRHGVTPEEAEEIFFQRPIVARSDVQHSKREKRYYVLGQTNGGRLLFEAFMIRRKLIRVVSARDMNCREAEVYRRYEENWKEQGPGDDA